MRTFDLNMQAFEVPWMSTSLAAGEATTFNMINYKTLIAASEMIKTKEDKECEKARKLLLLRLRMEFPCSMIPWFCYWPRP